jgi:hypothetical protein
MEIEKAAKSTHQQWLDENASPNDENSKCEAIDCPACARLHFVDRSTGKLLGDHERI